jgi:ankyrin repeat protein
LPLISCSISQTTPLHLAARHGHVEVAQLLLSRNAAVDAIDYEYRPYSCNVDKITLLILSCILPLTFAPTPLEMKPPCIMPPVVVTVKPSSCYCRATPLSTPEATSIVFTPALFSNMHC